MAEMLKRPLETPIFTDLETLKLHHFLWPKNEVAPQEYQWEGTDTPEVYARAKAGEFKTIYDENSFTYKLNSHFFRCGEFSDLDLTKPIFAVGGCSITFGTGVPLEDTWGYQVYLMLKEEFPTTQFINLGTGGTSIDYSVRVLSCFGDNIKHFDCYVNLLTELTRRELVHENSFLYPFLFSAQHFKNDNYHEDPAANRTFVSYARSFGMDDYWTKYQLNRNLLIFDLMSKAYDLPMLFDFWVAEEAEAYGFPIELVEERFKKYFENDVSKCFYSGIEPDVNVPEEQIHARDKMHPGIYYHTRYAKNIYPLVRQKFVSSIVNKNKIV